MKHDIYIQKEWDTNAYEKGVQLLTELQTLCPEEYVFLIGALVLRLPGKNDIDIGIDCRTKKHEDLLALAPVISAHLHHETTHIEPNFVQWDFERDGIEYDVVMYNSQFPGMDEQIRLHSIFEQHPELCSDYKTLKDSFNGKPYTEYEQAKIAFFAKVLKVN